MQGLLFSDKIVGIPSKNILPSTLRNKNQFCIWRKEIGCIKVSKNEIAFFVVPIPLYKCFLNSVIVCIIPDPETAV